MDKKEKSMFRKTKLPSKEMLLTLMLKCQERKILSKLKINSFI